MTLDGHTWVTFDDSIVGPWLSEQVEYLWVPGRTSSIGRIQDGRITAGVVYEGFNGASVMASMAATGPWANRNFLWLIFDYPFNQLKVERITVWVAESNRKSKRFVEKLGFEMESKMVRAHATGDILVYRMFKENCRWLRPKCC